MTIFQSRALPFTLLITLFAVVAATAISAQAQDNRKPPQQRQADAQARLQKEVRHVLVMLPYYSVFDNLAYKIDGDRVTLLGQVTRPTLKSDAGSAVKSIEDVAAVDNQIEVLPVSQNDDRIRRAVYRAIYSAPNLQKYGMAAVQSIHIIVKGGHVTLTGVVVNEFDKTLANMQAKTVSGVFSVADQIMVEK